MVEVCKHRLNLLSPTGSAPSESSILRSLWEVGLWATLVRRYQKNLAETDPSTGEAIRPGGEFRAAFDEAKRIGVPFFCMGDRPMRITIRRAWGSIGFWQKLKMISSGLGSGELESDAKEDPVSIRKKF